MKTDSRTAVMLLALDALVFADHISGEWDADKQIRHLREQIALARRHLESDPDKAMKQLKAEVELLRGCRAAEMEWEKLMMRLVGEDGLGSVETAVMALKQERDQLKIDNECLQGRIAVAGQLISDCTEVQTEFDTAWDKAARKWLAANAEVVAAHDAEVIDQFAESLALQAKSFPIGAECRSKGAVWYNWQMYFVGNMKSYAETLRTASQQAQEVQS